MSDFEPFINRCRIKKGQEQTHTSFNNGGASKLCITDVETFREFYVDFISAGGRTAITEKVSKTLPFPLYFDIDFDADWESSHEEITEFVLERLSLSISNVVTCDPILERIIATRNSYRLHIYYPDLFVNKDIAKSICNDLKKSIKVKFPDFVHADKLVDSSVYSSGLRIIGSTKGSLSKPEDRKKHELHFLEPFEDVYTVHGQDLSCHLLERTSIHNTGTLSTLSSLSSLVSFSSPPTLTSSSVDNIFSFETLEQSPLVTQDLTPSETQETIDRLERHLDPRIKRDYREFKRFVDSGCIRVLLAPQECPLALRTHSRCSRGQPSNYIILSQLGISIKCYKCEGRIEVHNNTIPPETTDENKLLLSSLYSQTHETISEHLFHKVKNQYAASLVRGGTYKHFYFDTFLHRWIHYEKLTLEIMANEGVIQKEYAAFVEQLLPTLEKPAQDLVEKNLKTIQRSLQTTGFVSGGIVPLLSRKLDFYWRGPKGDSFETRLDQDPQLIGFTNGVYDVRNLEFRAGSPLDFISMSTHISYEIPSLQIKTELDTFLSQLFVDPSHKAYFLQELASCLLGTQNQQRLFLLLGRGSNGKSTIAKLIDYTLGDYSGEFSSSLLTTPRPPAGSPTPELLCLKGKRFIVGSEPNSTDTLNLGTVKWLTGGDKIVGRNLHENSQSFYLQSTMFLLTNDVPQIKATASEWAVWRRLIPISFNSSFVKNPSKPGEFKTDLFLSDKLKIWNKAFMHLLLETLFVDPIPAPLEFQALANALKEKDDHYARFVTEYTVKETDVFMECQRMFLVFVEWIKVMQFNKKVNYDSFLRNMTFHLGEAVTFKGRKCWAVSVKEVVT